MTETVIGNLSAEDTEALDILAQAQQQYDRYLQLTKTLNFVSPQEELEEQPPSWDHPLTFVFLKSS